MDDLLKTLIARVPRKPPTMARPYIPPAFIEPGNIDLFAQPIVKNKDGSTSTVDSFSTNLEGIEHLLPTVMPDGRHLSIEDAIREFQRTGSHLGTFQTPSDATNYATQLHEEYAGGKYRKR